MNKAVIAGYCRSPFDFAHKGRLATLRADDLLAEVVKALLVKMKIPGEEIEDVVVGCSFPEGEQGLNVGRIVALHAGLPEKVGGLTLNRFCGSSMSAIHYAAGAIASGAGEAFLCGGVESMSRIPMGGFNFMPNPVLYERRPGVYASMGETAENIARQYAVSRQEQERFAVKSHQKAAHAEEKGSFAAERVSLQGEEGTIEKDGCMRPQTSLEILATLAPAFEENGSVTAGTSSPLTDGAAVVFVCSEDYALRKGIEPLATIVSCAVAGCAPEMMGIGPVEATRKVLDRAGLRLEDMDLFELNEAFASQALACLKELALDEEKVNVDGGALALGHPLGATGARITGKLASLLQREKKRYGIATQCIGGGQGIATLLERKS